MTKSQLTLWRPLVPYGHSYKPSCARPVSFVIFDIRALWRSGLSARVPRCQKLQMTQVWCRMVYSCTHMATSGVKGLRSVRHNYATQSLCLSLCGRHYAVESPVTNNLSESSHWFIRHTQSQGHITLLPWFSCLPGYRSRLITKQSDAPWERNDRWPAAGLCPSELIILELKTDRRQTSCIQ